MHTSVVNRSAISKGLPEAYNHLLVVYSPTSPLSGVPNNICETDNCPDLVNAGQEDNDGDGIGNTCDSCPNDQENDIDSDSICGDIDNCPNNSNPNQQDAYPPFGNGIGDACNCEGDFDCDSDTDGTDAATIKTGFGRSQLSNPCPVCVSGGKWCQYP